MMIMKVGFYRRSRKVGFWNEIVSLIQVIVACMVFKCKKVLCKRLMCEGQINFSGEKKAW